LNDEDGIISACQNPSLTYMALTARACKFATDRLRAGKI